MVSKDSNAVVIALAIFLFFQNVYGNDYSAISELKSLCKNLPTTIKPDQIALAMNAKLFPGPLDNLGVIMTRVENFNQTNRNHSCSIIKRYDTARVPKIFLDITKKATTLFLNDLRAQTEMVNTGHYCSEQLKGFLTKNSTDLGKLSSQEKDRYALSTSHPEQCLSFVNDFTPELQRRFQIMREYLFLSKKNQPIGKPIHHDKSFLSEFTSLYFDTVWRSGSASSVRPILAIDSERLQQKSNSMSKDQALEKYYNYLSTSPILVFFNDVPDGDSILQAFSKLKAQSNGDLLNLERNLPQDITLLLPYIFKALMDTPSENRGDACLLIQTLHENLLIRYEKMPIYIGVIGASMTFGAGAIVGLAATGAKTITMMEQIKAIYQSALLVSKTTSKGLAATASATAAETAHAGFQKYIITSMLCSKIVMTKQKDDFLFEPMDQRPLDMAVCDFQSAEKQFQKTQDSALAQAGFGILMAGAGKVFGLIGKN